jgi:hypothetical protein
MSTQANTRLTLKRGNKGKEREETVLVEWMRGNNGKGADQQCCLLSWGKQT